MEITRKQLRRLIESTVFPKNPVDYVSDPEYQEKINALINSDNEENRNMGYELAIMLQDDDIDPEQKKKIEDLMPPGATMDQRMGYAGDDYLDDLRKASNIKLTVGMMHAEIPGLSELEKYDRRLHNKFVKILLDPEGVVIWLEGSGHPNYWPDIPEKARELYYQIFEKRVKRLPDSFFDEPELSVAFWIKRIFAKNESKRSLILHWADWDKLHYDLVDLSGEDVHDIDFKILSFIHKYVKYAINI